MKPAKCLAVIQTELFHAAKPHGSSLPPRAPRSRRGEGEVLPLFLLYRLPLAVCGRHFLNGDGVGNVSHATLADDDETLGAARGPLRTNYYVFPVLF